MIKLNNFALELARVSDGKQGPTKEEIMSDILSIQSSLP
jgi:hypothetical protein